MRSLPNCKWFNDDLILLPDILDKAWQVIRYVINKVGSIPIRVTKIKKYMRPIEIIFVFLFIVFVGHA